MSISAERRQQAFDQSITFAEFVDEAQNFAAEFRNNYAFAELDDRDRRALAAIDGTIDVLAIVEDWCPDVVANLPIIARAAHDTDRLRLHVLVRGDATRDVADAYPFEGRSHIPTYVFSDAVGTELGVIVERTAAIQEHVDTFLDSFFAAHPEVDRATFPVGITKDHKSELRETSLSLRNGLRDLERNSLIEAIATLAATRTPIPVGASSAAS